LAGLGFARGLEQYTALRPLALPAVKHRGDVKLSRSFEHFSVGLDKLRVLVDQQPIDASHVLDVGVGTLIAHADAGGQIDDDR
jgi:hypothetical protein